MSAPRPPQLASAEWRRRAYVDEGLAMADIARELGCTHHTVRRALDRHGIPLRPPPRRPGSGPQWHIEVGTRFGRLVVVDGPFRDPKRGVPLYRCCCDCGEGALSAGLGLLRGIAQSCGCLRRERAAVANTKHGHAGRGGPSATWGSWSAMVTRCHRLRPDEPDYQYYRGRGIRVCDRWNPYAGGTFVNFLADMGERPPAKTLDGINPDGNYEPANCRWATASQQTRNRRPHPNNKENRER